MRQGHGLGALGACAAAIATVTAVLAGCPQTTPPPVTPSTEDEVEGPTIPAAQLCSQACERFSACTPELAATMDLDAGVLADHFVYECGESCASLAGPASAAHAPITDCVALANCEAFYTCSSGPVAAPAAADGRAPGGADAGGNDPSNPDRLESCDVLCDRELECRGLTPGDDPATEILNACHLDCAAQPTTSAERADAADPSPDCQERRTCSEFVACLDGRRERAPEPPQRPPGVSVTCDQLCSRAIECGAQTADLSKAQRTALRENMASTYMECAVLCGKELAPSNRVSFDKCIAEESCELFEACADVL